MLIKDILEKKGTQVRTVPLGTSVRQAAREMIEHKVGAVVIAEGSKVLGIFTERDNLRLTSTGPYSPDETTIDGSMTSDVVVGLPSDSIEAAMAVMTEKRVRHLPIISDGLLVGIVSIGDVVRAISEKQKAEIHYMRDYISGTMG
ncbi:MAG: CBS domain-containing protein [bacterium]